MAEVGPAPPRDGQIMLNEAMEANNKINMADDNCFFFFFLVPDGVVFFLKSVRFVKFFCHLMLLPLFDVVVVNVN